MIPEYKDNYQKYYQDQMTKFESFERELYAEGIAKTIDYIFQAHVCEGKVLDFCCGDGTTSKFLVEKGFDVIGFDGNENKINKATLETDAIFFTMDAQDTRLITMGGHFDIIYASHCFEHFLDPMSILEDCKRLLNKNGEIILILPYPNEESEGHPGANLLKLNQGLFEITDNFEDNGFKVTSIEKVNFREPEIIVHLCL